MNDSSDTYISWIDFIADALVIARFDQNGNKTDVFRELLLFDGGFPSISLDHNNELIAAIPRIPEPARAKMNNGTNPNGGSPTAALLLGASFYGLAHLWGQYMVAGDAADDLYTGMFKVIGGIAMLGGLGGYYKGWAQREKRKASQETSGTFGGGPVLGRAA